MCAALIVDYLVEAAPVVLCYNLYGRVLLRLPTLCRGVCCYLVEVAPVGSLVAAELIAHLRSDASMSTNMCGTPTSFTCRWSVMDRWMARSYACIHVCMHVCMCVCMHVCMYACMHVCMYVCLCILACMDVRMYVCMYACLHASRSARHVHADTITRTQTEAFR